MQPPDELMVQDFLPAMRQLVARELRSEGFSQSKIASLLGTTQASVSLYLSSDHGKAYALLSRLSVGADLAGRYAGRLASEVQKGGQAGVIALNEIWAGLLGSGSVCPAHRALYPSLSTCDFCLKEYGLKDEASREAVAEVEDAVKLIEATPTFASVMPEVSVNIACVAGRADSPSEVVAVPGRIAKVRGRARAMLPPEAGASTHLSKMLLLVRRRSPSVRACINLAYDPRMARAVSSLKLKALVLGERRGRRGADPTVAALEAKLRRPVPAFDVIVDSGGEGIEPSLYVFGSGAREVARLAAEISRAYSPG